mmetsp:Transcript_22290/g.56338  ORF Transcript_22290/g.56338 Transcript_22290/m.56338 type:complete len:459 (-) Transcript_22290:303-1679(-)|eukprot:g9966.t1
MASTTTTTAVRQNDMFGYDITADSAAAINSYFVAVLEYRPFAVWARVLEAPPPVGHQTPTATPDPLLFALQLDYRTSSGSGPVLSSSPADEELLASFLEESEESSKSRSRSDLRAHLYLAAMKAWRGGDLEASYEKWLAVLKTHRNDLFACKRAQLMGLLLGKPEKILAASSAAHTGKSSYWFAMHAFALEQVGDWAGSAKAVEDGKRFYEEKQVEKDPWLLHSEIHLHHQAAAALLKRAEGTNEPSEPKTEALEKWRQIIHLLESYAERCLDKDALEGRLHVFLYTHFFWHLGVAYVEAQEWEKANRLFRDRLWGCFVDARDEVRLKDPQVQLNALGLAWRLLDDTTLDETRHSHLSKFAADLAPVFCRNVDPLLDVLYVRVLGSEEERKIFCSEMRIFANGKRAELTQAADIADAVAGILSSHDAEQGVCWREKLRDSDWACLGNSWEQRAVLETL